MDEGAEARPATEKQRAEREAARESAVGREESRRGGR